MFVAREDSFLNASEARVCPGKEARVVIWDDEVSLLSALLATCSGWTVCDVISSCSCTSWRGDMAALEARFARGEKGNFSLRNLMFLCKNLPRLLSGAVEGGVKNKIMSA